MNFDLILNKFSNGKRLSNGSYQCSCPLPSHKHGDKSPSLTITEKEDRVLLFCHVCGETATPEILQVVGLEGKDLFKANWNKETSPTYSSAKGNEKTYSLDWIINNSTSQYFYNNEKNEYEILKIRYMDKDTGEEVKGCFYHYTGCDKWIKNLNGKKPQLYKLPELLQAINREEEYIFDVEGEKDVDTLTKLGLTAVTSGSAKSWKDEFKEYYRGARKVAIFFDNDQPGREYAEQKAKSLYEIVGEVKIINLPGVKDKEDVTDWINSGHTKEELIQLVKTASLYSPPVIQMKQKKDEKNNPTWRPLETISAEEFSKIEYPPIKFLVQDILPEGLSILGGSPKIGKTFFALNLALSIANGDTTLGSLQTEKTGVAYFAVDEKDQYVQDKFNNIREFQKKYDIPENLEFGFKMNRLSEGGYEQITDFIDRKPELKLIVIDTLGRVRRHSGQGNAYEVDVEAIGQLQDICKEKNVSILLLHHNKKGKSEDYIENLSGSMGITGTVDTILYLDRKRGETEGVLKVTGRLIKDEKDLSIKFNKDILSWEILGDAELYRQSNERKEIIDILLTENYPLTNKDLQAITEMNYSTIKGLTWRMAKDGILIKVNNGAYVVSPSFLFGNNLNPLNLINPLNSLNPLNPESRVDTVDLAINKVNPEKLNDSKGKNAMVDRVDVVDVKCLVEESNESQKVITLDTIKVNCGETDVDNNNVNTDTAKTSTKIIEETNNNIDNTNNNSEIETIVTVTCASCIYGISKSAIGFHTCSVTGKCNYRGHELHNCLDFSPAVEMEEEIIEAPF